MALDLNPKSFIDKLNQCLDDIPAPKEEKKRCAILMDLFDISKFDAQSLLAGRQLPSQELIEKIAVEFEIKEWLDQVQHTHRPPSR